jgi:hypothetical protein
LINNRQNGRRRRGRTPQGGNGRGPDNGSRIDNRARGNAPQMLEKYRNLAREAQMQSDRVMTEYYLQFADHYFRIVAENKARFEENQSQRDNQGGQQGSNQPRRSRDDWQSDDGYEGETSEGDTQGDSPEGDDAPRAERQERPERQERGERQERLERAERSERPERNAYRDNPERSQRPERAERAERPARPERAPRRERPSANSANGNVAEGNEAAPLTLDLAVLPPSLSVADDTPAAVESEKPAPRRRARPKLSAAEPETAAEG